MAYSYNYQVLGWYFPAKRRESSKYTPQICIQNIIDS